MLGSAGGARPPLPQSGGTHGEASGHLTGSRPPTQDPSTPTLSLVPLLHQGPRTRAPATWPAVLLLAFELFTCLCCFRNRLKILKNLTRQEVAAEIDQRGDRLWCQQGLQEAGWLFSSFTHRYIPKG